MPPDFQTGEAGALQLCKYSTPTVSLWPRFLAIQALGSGALTRKPQKLFSAYGP